MFEFRTEKSMHSNAHGFGPSPRTPGNCLFKNARKFTVIKFFSCSSPCFDGQYLIFFWLCDRSSFRGTRRHRTCGGYIAYDSAKLLSQARDKGDKLHNHGRIESD
jgi:hypothetical protein